ncbi:MAG: hypothetical protein A3B44_03315 [Candidatus Levybacteria bacterium RIFCSPLOWO2_01_FULL_38_21]|nr:MAG: hypothetical protein A3B44_03315 [Candidatus Levybacteria bacterium RIFCSPLOWO2_01_FULL_38_21]
MRKIIGRIGLLLIIVCLLVPAFPKIFAQEVNLLLSVTPYTTRDDTDFLFSQSTKVLAYLEGEEVKEPLFLSLITEQQRKNFINKGFNPKILDYSTDISRYALFYHPKPNQSAKLQAFGEVIPVSSYYTLLKTPVGVTLAHEGVIAEFFDVPFPEKIVPPNLEIKKTIPASTGTTFPASVPKQEKKEISPFWIVFLVVVIFIVIVALILRKLGYIGRKGHDEKA